MSIKNNIIPELGGVAPKYIERGRAKIMFSGDAGTGKTELALQFPGVVYFDHEEGADEPEYRKILIDSGGLYFGPHKERSNDLEYIEGQAKALACRDHKYKTIVHDSLTELIEINAITEAERVGTAFSRHKKEVYGHLRKILYWYKKTDMNIVFIAHEKEKWKRIKGRDGKDELISDGTTFDGWPDLKYLFNLWLETKIINNEYYLEVKKSRIASFPMGELISNKKNEGFNGFAERYGKEIICKESKPFELATQEQLIEFNKLIKHFDISKERIDKWLDDKKIDSFEEASKEDMQTIIDKYNKKMEEK